jgi:hypothetical protein
MISHASTPPSKTLHIVGALSLRDATAIDAGVANSRTMLSPIRCSQKRLVVTEAALAECRNCLTTPRDAVCEILR